MLISVNQSKLNTLKFSVKVHKHVRKQSLFRVKNYAKQAAVKEADILKGYRGYM